MLARDTVGHQGLFAERLDAVTTADPLDAGSRVAWHNRNRTFLPELGRFAQRDPNETGQAARGTLNMHGTAFHDAASAPDPMSLFGDGMNVYAYAMGSPTQNQDPSGLFVGFLVPGPSDFITGALEGMVENYAVRLEWDVEWATDWDLPDDIHSRNDDTWVHLAMLGGVYDAFSIGVGGLSVNPLDLVAGRESAGPGMHWHHIMTNKNYKAGLQWSVRYEKLFKKHKIEGNPFSWTENLVALPNHQGPHPDKYHAKIYKMVEAALKSSGKPADKEMAVRNTLGEINRELKRTGGKAYDLKRPGRR